MVFNCKWLNLASKSPSRESKSPRSQLSRNLSPFSLAKKGSRLLPEENFDLSGQPWGQGRSQRSSVTPHLLSSASVDIFRSTESFVT